MAQHWGEKLVELLIGKMRRSVTKFAGKTADHTTERFPAIAALYEQVGPDNATDFLNMVVEVMPDPDTRTITGKGIELAKDFVERFIYRLQEGLGGDGTIRGGGAVAVPAGKLGNMFGLLDPAVVEERRKEFLGFMKLLTSRQRRAVVEFILDRELAERQAFLALPLEERMLFIWLLIPQTKTSEIERLKSEIRIRWTYGERLFAEAARAHAEAARFRGRDRLAVEILMEEAREKEQEAQQLVASLNDLQNELLQIGYRSRPFDTMPQTTAALREALEGFRRRHPRRVHHA